MKKRLLLICGIATFWLLSIQLRAQVPEFLYYKFEDSSQVVNYASDPRGDNNIPIPPNLYVDTTGMNGSKALVGTGDSARGGVRTGFYPDYSRSFTISFWYENTAWPNDSVILNSGEYRFDYIFGDSLANFHCYNSFAVEGGTPMSLLFVTAGPEISGSGVMGMGAVQVGTHNVIHIVYDATPTAENSAGTYGTYTMYINGMPDWAGSASLEKGLPLGSSGLVIGSAAGIAPHLNPGIDLNVDMAGNLDEFRWYDRALTLTEIQNTINADVMSMGVCSPYSRFTIDSISAETVRIDWIPGTGNDAFFLEYGPVGFTRGTGTLISGNYPGGRPPVALDHLSPETEYDIYFGEYCNGGTDSIYNPRPRTFKTTPLCPTPVYIDFLSVTRDSVELTWKYTRPVEEYYITYGPSGFNPTTSGETDTAYSLPYKIGGLSPETLYDFYVATVCGGTYGNSMEVMRSMRTDCDIKTAPYFEDFQDSTWKPYHQFLNYADARYVDTLNNCWTKEGAANEWSVRTGAVVANQTQYYFMEDTNNQFLTTKFSPFSYGEQISVYTPFIDISNLSAPYLSFSYYRQFPMEHTLLRRIQPDLYIEVNDGNRWETVKEIKGYEQSNESVTGLNAYFDLILPAEDPFKKCGINLSGFADTIQVRFRAVSLDGFRYIGDKSGITLIDSISVDEIPECPDIFNVALIKVYADTSMMIDIESSAVSYTLEMGPRGFEQGTGCSGTFTEPYTFDSCITVNQDMDLYIQGCNSGTWRGPYEICAPRTAPYYTGFDEKPFIVASWDLGRDPVCWEMYASGKQSQGDLVKVFPELKNYNLGSDGKRNSKLNLYNYTAQPHDTLMAISPAFVDLPTGNKQVRFKAALMETNNGMERNVLIVGTVSDPKSGNTFEAIDTVDLQYYKWKEYTVEINTSSAYNGEDLYIAIKQGEGIITCLIDDFYYEEIPTCPAPLFTSLQSEDIWMDAVTIQWQSPNEVPAILRYGQEGFDPDGNNHDQLTTAMDTFYRVTGLAPGTTYDLYIRDSCGPNDYSQWTGPITFTTLCHPFTTPYLEDFDSSTWTPAPPDNPYDFGHNYDNIDDTLDFCWRRNIAPGTPRYMMEIDSLKDLARDEKYHTWGITQDFAGHSDSHGGPVSDYSGTGNYAVSILRHAVTDAGKEEGIGDLYSPLIDLSSLSHPYLTFYYHRFGEARMPDFWVEVNDGQGWDTVKYYRGPEPAQTSVSSPYYQAGVDLSGFNDTIQIRFRSLHQYSTPHQPTGLTAIDNIEVKEAPPCIKPEGLTEEHYINASAGGWNTVLRWEPSASLTDGYEVLIGNATPAFDPDSLSALGLGIYVEAADSLVMDTLRHGQCYEFVVRSICASGDTSDYSNTFTFCLPCIQQAPVTENFDVFTLERFDRQDLPSSHLGYFYQPCWYYESDGDAVDEDGVFNYSWVNPTEVNLADFIKTPGSTPEDADGCVVGKFLFTKSNYSQQGGDSTLLYSPVVDIRPLTAPELSFSYLMYGSDIDALHLDIYDGVNWHNNVILLEGQQQTSSDPWRDTIISLNTYNITGLVQARFWAKKKTGTWADRGSNPYNNIAIDNFRISDPVNCPAPSCFHVSDTADSTVTLKWYIPAGATNFEVEYGPRDYVYGQGTKVVTTNDSLIVNVQINRLYDAYIRSVCAGGDSSLIAGPVPFQSLLSSCDDFEGYILGSLTDQSGLFHSYAAINEDIPGVGFESRGDEEITTLYANSGNQSLRLHEGIGGSSSALAYFDEIENDFVLVAGDYTADLSTRDVYTVDFSFSITDTGGGFYDLIPYVKKDFRAGRSIPDILFRFDQTSMMWQSLLRADPSVIVDSFKYKAGWNDLRHVIDLDRDSIWIVLNGKDMQVGWRYSDGTALSHIGASYSIESRIKRLEGVYFLTTPNNLNTTTRASEFYIDDFCVSPYECPEPAELAIDQTSCTRSSISWTAGVEGATTILEYGPTGYTRGEGDTLHVFNNNYTLEDLTPGASYDVYVSERCGFDTVFTGPVSFTLLTEATADFAFTKGNATNQELSVNFDGSASVGAEGYIWNFGDGNIANGISPVHIYTQNGSYNVQLIIESDCGNDTITKTIEIKGIGLEENILTQSLEVYPNPFTDKVQLSFETQSSEDAVLRLTDPSGKVILQQRASNINSSYSGEMNLGHLAKGTYMLRVECGEVSAVKRIVKN